MTDSARLTTDHRRGLVVTAVGGLLFTLDVPLLRLAGGDQWTMIFARGLFLAFAISAWWYVHRQGRGIRVPFINGWPGAIVAFTNTLANIMFIAAVTKTTAANLVFILALNPIFCAIIGWVFLKERLPLPVLCAIVLSLCGVSIIVGDGLSTGTYIGDALAVGVALCTAVGLTVVRQSGRNIVPSLAVGSFASALVAYLFMAADPASLSISGWGWLALNGLFIIPLASGLIALGPKYIPASEVAMFFLLDTALTPLWIWFIFGELPTLKAFCGGLIIFLTLLGLGLWRILGGRTEADPTTVPPHPV